MKYSIVCLFIFSNVFAQTSNSYSGGGTTIITLFTKDTIWIASDSRISADPPLRPHPDTLCKIGNYNNIFFELSGNLLLFNLKKDTIFNAFKIMKVTLTKYKLFEKSYGRFNEEVVKELNKFFKTKDAIEDKAGFLALNNPFMAMNMIAWDSIHANYKFFRYVLDEKTYSIRIEEDFPPQKTSFSNCIGYCKTINPIMGTYFKNYNSKEALIKLIQIQISNYPKLVAEPISVVALFKGGHKWLTSNNPVYFSTDY